MILNRLVGGNCSAFVPWQITERDKSIHALVVMGAYTRKSHRKLYAVGLSRRGRMW